MSVACRSHRDLHHTVLAGTLRRVHGLIGLAEQLVGPGLGAGDRQHADAGGDRGSAPKHRADAGDEPGGRGVRHETHAVYGRHGAAVRRDQNRLQIVFPAGLLQRPFFFASGDDAVNYGGIGCVIGHEMTHGFDDQGRQYDKVGNLTDWWSPQSAEEFKKRSDAIVQQYNEYEPLPGLHVNGALTEGENIADVGGVKIAYAALQKALDKHPEERDKKIDGFTPEQRFFLSFAAIWRSKIRDEEQKLRLNTDPHSPGHYRVNGPLSDLPEFQKAFNVPDGAPMFRAADKRVNIW